MAKVELFTPLGQTHQMSDDGAFSKPSAASNLADGQLLMFALPDNTKACLFQGPHGSKMIDPREAWHNQTSTSISRTSASLTESSIAAKYS